MRLRKQKLLLNNSVGFQRGYRNAVSSFFIHVFEKNYLTYLKKYGSMDNALLW